MVVFLHLSNLLGDWDMVTLSHLTFFFCVLVFSLVNSFKLSLQELWLVLGRKEVGLYSLIYFLLMTQSFSLKQMTKVSIQLYKLSLDVVTFWGSK